MSLRSSLSDSFRRHNNPVDLYGYVNISQSGNCHLVKSNDVEKQVRGAVGDLLQGHFCQPPRGRLLCCVVRCSAAEGAMDDNKIVFWRLLFFNLGLARTVITTREYRYVRSLSLKLKKLCQLRPRWRCHLKRTCQSAV